MLRRYVVAILAGALVLALAACGDDEAPGNGTQGTTVAVTLAEFSVVPATSSAPAGNVTFNVENKGPADKHELVVIKTDLAPDALPTKTDGSVDEDGAGIDVIDEIEEFDPGTSESKTMNLTAGKYVFICNIVEIEDGKPEAHYGVGMRTAFTVT